MTPDTVKQQISDLDARLAELGPLVGAAALRIASSESEDGDQALVDERKALVARRETLDLALTQAIENEQREQDAARDRLRTAKINSLRQYLGRMDRSAREIRRCVIELNLAYNDMATAIRSAFEVAPARIGGNGIFTPSYLRRLIVAEAHADAQKKGYREAALDGRHEGLIQFTGRDGHMIGLVERLGRATGDIRADLAAKWGAKPNSNSAAVSPSTAADTAPSSSSPADGGAAPISETIEPPTDTAEPLPTDPTTDRAQLEALMREELLRMGKPVPSTEHVLVADEQVADAEVAEPKPEEVA